MARLARGGGLDIHTSRWWFVLRIGMMNEIYGEEAQWTWKAISQCEVRIVHVAA